MKPFGKLLAELRKRAGISQNDLAQIIKTNPTHISKIERGERNPPKMNTLIEMAKALGINEDKETMNEFISSSLFSRKAGRPLVYSSPLSEDDIADFVDEESKTKVLESPAVKLIAEILNDPRIPGREKKIMEKQTISFIGWLKEERKKKHS